MADDTRLAEACLLLNYSNQSYREQMLLTKRLQESSGSSDSSLCNPCATNTKEPSSSKLITPPPEHECSAQESSPFGDNNSMAEINLATDGTQESTINHGLGVNANYYNNHYNDLSVDPLHNLLAAANCASPGFRSRPNILQRPSSSRSVNCSTELLEHDYCIKAAHQTSNEGERMPASRNKHNDCFANQKHRKQKYSHTTLADYNHSDSSLQRKPLKLVAVHLGAGNAHNESESLELAKAICEEVMLQTKHGSNVIANPRKRRKLLQNNAEIGSVNGAQNLECSGYLDSNSSYVTAETAVVQLVSRMEDIQSLNCGYGSNLTMKGQVECDASLMSDRRQIWTGIGAISGCKNPILLAKSLYDYQLVPRPLGLIQPNLLVGSGAKQWMREHCPHLNIIDSKMISSKSFSTYQKLKSRYDAAVKSARENSVNPLIRSRYSSNIHKCPIDYAQSPTTLDHGFYCAATRDNLRKATSFAGATERIGEFDEKQTTSRLDVKLEFQEQNTRLDTVGAIAVDCDNIFSAAISSGGLLLKYKGRVGQAAVPGAGCWSEDCVAVTTTGVGEYLTVNLFARKFYDKMLTLRTLFDLGHVEKKPDLSDLISCTMDECFEDLLVSPALAHVAPHERLAGMLSVSSLNSKSDLSPKRIDDKDLYLTYGHNTNAMCVGYMTCDDTTGHSLISRRNFDEQDGKATIETLKFSLDFNNYTNSHRNDNDKTSS